ncbi:XRE family transcriptional regulator [Streptococcus dentiloxodontae]
MFSGQRLKDIREEKGYSQAEVAKRLGISRSSYFNWENGKTKPNQKNLSVLSEIFGVTETYFLSEHEIVDVYLKLSSENKKKSLDFAKKLLAQEKLKQEEVEKAPVVELFSYKVFEKLSAGTGFSYFGDGNYDEVFYDEALDHDFASWVFGDSMEPTYLNGEVVLIKQTGFDYDGAVYAVDWNGQTYIKKVYREEEGLRLVSLNKRYADKFAPYDEEPRIIGKIVGNFMPIEA